jgi:hypothetical protein
VRGINTSWSNVRQCVKPTPTHTHEGDLERGGSPGSLTRHLPASITHQPISTPSTLPFILLKVLAETLHLKLQIPQLHIHKYEDTYTSMCVGRV